MNETAVLPRYAHVLQDVMRLMGDRRLSSVEAVMDELPDLKWKTGARPGGGKIVFAVIDGDKETREIHIFAVLENASAPAHTHRSGALYGELILTIAGALKDQTDDGEPILLLPGMHLVHGPNTTHQPSASEFWFGYYHQPHGSDLVGSG